MLWLNQWFEVHSYALTLFEVYACFHCRYRWRRTRCSSEETPNIRAREYLHSVYARNDACPSFHHGCFCHAELAGGRSRCGGPNGVGRSRLWIWLGTWLNSLWLRCCLYKKGGSMQYNMLGKTGLQISRLSFGASSLGGVFHPVEETDAIAAVHAALDCGINYFDVAPAYGGTRSETVLGNALRGIPRDRYFLSTKVGKYTDPNKYGSDTLDYSRTRIRASLNESAERLGTDYFDIIHIHDIEYQNRKHTEWALTEGYEAVQELKREGRIGNVSFGIYPMDLWKRIIAGFDIDAALIHNHYCLNDTQLLDLLPMAKQSRVGIINGSPFASGLLTDRGAPAWHPASAEQQRFFHVAAQFCRGQGTSISKVALQFSSQHPEIPTTMFSTANPETVKRNVAWHKELCDMSLVTEIQKILSSVFNKEWHY
jgi:L-galactose dehydrogenase